MSTFIPAKIGPSFPSEVAAAGLSGQPFSWTSEGVAADAALSADKLAQLQFLIVAHDPTKPDPNPSTPVPSCTKLGLKRAFDEKGIWPKVRDMINADPDMLEDWNLAVELRVTDPIVKKAVAGLAQAGIVLSNSDVLALVARANALVA